MLEPDPSFRPVRTRDGYPPLSPLGLLSEQIDPGTGEFIGNYPQAFSHIGVIASGVTLARAKARAGEAA